MSHRGGSVHSDFVDFQHEVIKTLQSFGVKHYYARLSTIDFRSTAYDCYTDKEAVDSTAVKLLIKIKQCYTGKVMISDGPCGHSGTV